MPKALARIETQTTSTRFWTRVIISISYDDNRYTNLDKKTLMFYLKS